MNKTRRKIERIPTIYTFQIYADFQRLMCGSGAGAIAVIFTYPLDMIRARMALQFHATEYNNWRHAVRTIYAQEVN